MQSIALLSLALKTKSGRFRILLRKLIMTVFRTLHLTLALLTKCGRFRILAHAFLRKWIMTGFNTLHISSVEVASAFDSEVEMLLGAHVPLNQISVRLFEFVKLDFTVFEATLFLLLAIVVQHMVSRTIRPNILTFAVFLAIFPGAVKPFPIRIVQRSLPIAVVILELSIIYLSIWPHIYTFSSLASRLEKTEEETTIRPLVQSLTSHGIIRKLALVHFTAWCDTSTVSIDLPIRKEALKNGIARVNFEAKAIRFLI